LRTDLTAVGVGPRIRHGQKPGRVVFELEIFVLELFAVDALSSSTIVFVEVATLKHELGYNAVETRSFVAEALFLCAQEPEVARSFGGHVVKELEDDATRGPAADGDIEEHVCGG
jgi:hypothetical protein